MSATNHTPNYDLSQFEPDDVPSWQGDYNSDMEKIDKAIHDISINYSALAPIKSIGDGLNLSDTGELSSPPPEIMTDTEFNVAWAKA